MQRKRVSLIITVLISLILIGCSSTPRTIEVRSKSIDPVPLVLPEVDVLELKDVQFYVVTEENYVKVFEELRKKNYTPVIFGMSDDGYAEQAVNMAKILQLVQQQKAIIVAYKEYYNDTSEKLQDHNDRIQEEATNEAVLSEQKQGVNINGFLLKNYYPGNLADPIFARFFFACTATLTYKTPGFTDKYFKQAGFIDHNLISKDGAQCYVLISPKIVVI